MIKKAGDLTFVVTENMRGGVGSVAIKQLAEQAEMYDKNRLCATIVIKPGCSVGYHVHENEMELYYILSGKALYDDNGTEVELSPGDVTITPSGEGHAIANNGDVDLEFIALIALE
jgi:mannose-6-phosphate isomerase-like protein (cupin superfamily)